jgi:chromate reductase, NAD(P)H dehydrogenase (quinone)
VTSVLTVSGSLRTGSSNATLLAAAARLAPAGVTVSPYDALAALPAFNPDIEEGRAGPVPNAVLHWRAAVATADAVLFSSPEYAHGIPGVLKNALDWLVGSSEIVGKRVGLLSASAASRFAHPQLIEVLTVMSATLVPEATVVIDIPRRGVDASQLAADPVVAPALVLALTSLVAQVVTPS